MRPVFSDYWLERDADGVFSQSFYDTKAHSDFRKEPVKAAFVIKKGILICQVI